MKKLLLATSILAGSAGVAAAEIAFSGNAYMGMFGVSGSGSSDFVFIARARTTVTMTGETDGGLSFGAKYDLHNAAAAGASGTASCSVDDADADGVIDVGEFTCSSNTNQNNGAAAVWIEGSFGKISMGDVGSAADNLIGHVSKISVDLPSGLFQELIYIGNPKTAMKYEGTFGDFTVAASVGQLETGTDTYSVAFKYSAGDYAFYLGYEDAEGTTNTIAGADATFGNFTVKARVSDFNTPGAELGWALSGTGTFDAIEVTAFIADQYGLVTAYGLGASYDLGGGAKFVGGLQTWDVSGAPTWIDVGLKFSF
jgi:outer membrane protein OmpU